MASDRLTLIRSLDEHACNVVFISTVGHDHGGCSAEDLNIRAPFAFRFALL